MSLATFDIFIIGGGINGCGIARDAAGRGYSVMLAEMNDLASGTSSWSTKLVHGGLRYLEHYEFKLVREALEFVHRTFTIHDETQLRVAVVHQLIERQVTDILGHCVAMLSSFEPSSSLEARQIEGLVGTSSELAEQKQELEAFLYARVYRHPDLIAVRERAQARLQRMFHEYQREPSWFPEKYQRRAERVGVRKMAVDYLAGMTDRFCDDRFHEMFPGEVEA